MSGGKRKTIDLAYIKLKANTVLRDSEDAYADGRRHIQSFVEDILMKTDSYAGFAYLTKDEAAPGKSHGIEWSEAAPGPTFKDQTRIRFF